MADQFFTPAEMAAKMVIAFRSRHEECVADFAAGDGQLLRAARERWPECAIVGTDIDGRSVSLLKRWEPTWSVGKCDFLNANSRRASHILRQTREKASLILLNPPFSCRGNKRYSVAVSGKSILCSRALAFVLNALPYLNKKGRLAAVLPTGCLTSEKDRCAWEYLNQEFSLRIVASYGLRTFEQCAARTTIVSLRRLGVQEADVNEARPGEPRSRITVEIIRGVVPMHVARNGMAGSDWPLVHTTDLKGAKVMSPSSSVRCTRRYATGPSVLMPRVGQPSKGKLALYLRNKRLVLSDCVYALRCGTSDEARTVHSALVKAWNSVCESYGGTCARYLTLNALHKLLRQLGFDPKTHHP